MSRQQLIPSVLQSQVLAKLNEIHQAIQREEYSRALEAERSIIDIVFIADKDFDKERVEIEEFYTELDNVRGLPGRIQVPTLSDSRREEYFKRQGRVLSINVRQKIAEKLHERKYLEGVTIGGADNINEKDFAEVPEV